MPGKKTSKSLNADEKYAIALEAVIATGSKSGSFETVASKHSLKSDDVKKLMKQGLEGFKAAFYGNPDISQGIKELTSLLDEIQEESNDTQNSDESEDSENGLLKPEELYQLIEEHNDLVAAYRKKTNDLDKYPYIAITGGQLKDYCGLSQYRARQYLEANPEYKNINSKYQLKGTDNQNKPRNYDFLSTIKELSSESEE